MIYSSVKDLVGAFAGDKKKFDKPVMVELMPGGAKATRLCYEGIA